MLSLLSLSVGAGETLLFSSLVSDSKSSQEGEGQSYLVSQEGEGQSSLVSQEGDGFGQSEKSSFIFSVML